MPSQDSKARFSILGLGAIGTLYAVALKQAGFAVDVLSRSTDQPQLKRNLTRLDGTSQQHSFSVTSSQPIEVLLCCLKAHQVVPALLQQQQQITADTIVVLMHNGLGTMEQLRPQLRCGAILLASTTHGARRHGPNDVTHTGGGETWLGLGCGNISPAQRDALVQAFDLALAPCCWFDDIVPQLWRKLAINSVINPLTTLFNCRNGALLEARFSPLIETLIDEFATLAKAEQLLLPELRKTVLAVAAATAANDSSMKCDLARQQLTEIDYITGYLLIKAATHGLKLPTHNALYEAIRFRSQPFS